MRRSFLALALAASIVPATALQATSFSTLEERMSAAEFRSAGLEKLSPEELAALNAWLAKSGTNRSNVAAPVDDRRGFTERHGPRDDGEFKSRIVGRFDGLAPRETFRLENGQVWRSTDSTVIWRGVTSESPSATIRKGTFGGWRMRLDDHKGMAKVERVE